MLGGCLGAPLGGTLSQDEPVYGHSTILVGNTTIDVLLEIGDSRLAEGEETELAARATNTGPGDYHYTNAGCPGESFFFQLKVGGEFAEIVPLGETRVWPCAEVPMVLRPGESASWSERWAGEVSDQQTNFRPPSGQYELTTRLNGGRGVSASVYVELI